MGNYREKARNRIANVTRVLRRYFNRSVHAMVYGVVTIVRYRKGAKKVGRVIDGSVERFSRYGNFPSARVLVLRKLASLYKCP